MDEKPAEQPKKKRPWFQIHLSTAIVLSLLAAGILAVYVPNLPPEMDIATALKWYWYAPLMFAFLLFAVAFLSERIIFYRNEHKSDSQYL